MADESFWWIYLLFLMVPLARILPRILRRSGGFGPPRLQREARADEVRAAPRTAEPAARDDRTPDRKVLGQMSLGVRDFARIRENLGMEDGELESILQDLEKDGLMRVVRKGGMLGTKVELHITEKGIKRYHS